MDFKPFLHLMVVKLATFWLYSLGGFIFSEISQKICQKISATQVKNSKADMFIIVSPLPVIMEYFVLPKSSCIKWEIGNLDTSMFFEISQCVLKILYDKASKIKNLMCPFSKLSFMRYFYLSYLTVSV